MSGKTDYFALAKTAREGQLTDTVYLFFGPEHYLADGAVRLVTDHFLDAENRDFNLLKLDARDLEAGQLGSELNSLPFFSSFRVLIIKNAEKYFGNTKKRSQEEEDLLVNWLDNPNPACCVIFVMGNKPDSRKRVYKRILAAGTVVEFPHLRDYQLSKWLKERLEQRGRQISTDALNFLIAGTVNDLSAFEHELEKLTLYAPDAKKITVDMVRMTSSPTAGAGIFDLVDAVGEKRISKAIDLLREMLVAGEPPVYILFMLARQYRLILAAKSLARQGIAEKQIQAKLSLHPFVLKKVLQQTKNFSEQDLQQGLRYILEADVGLKNSYGEPGYLLEMAIMKISS